MEMIYKSNFLSLTLGLFFLSPLLLKGQTPTPPTWQTVDSIQIPHQSFTFDRFGFAYIISPTGDLIKLDPNRQKKFTYSNSRLGELTSVDVSNPLAVLCFYKDYQHVTVLDRTLNLLATLDLADWGLVNVTAVCNSGDNQLWVYDESDMQITKIAKDRSTPTRSFPFILDTDDPILLTKMAVHNDYLYGLSEKGNVYHLSLIGESLQQILPQNQFIDFQFANDRLLLMDTKGKVFQYVNWLDLNPVSLPFSLPQNKSWHFQGKQFFYGDGKTIWVLH